jgi:hypothetical protein
MRGGPADDRQSRWWDERRSDYGSTSDPDSHRPEAEAGAARVPAQRRPVQRTEVEQLPAPAPMSAARRPALPAGSGGMGAGGGNPGAYDPTEVDDRVIYRRPDAVPLRPGGARPVQAELVDGRPVYRIYRPRATQSAYSPTPYRPE